MTSPSLSPFTFKALDGDVVTVDAEFIGDLRIHPNLVRSGVVNVSNSLGLRMGSYPSWKAAKDVVEALYQELPHVRWGDGNGPDVFDNPFEAELASLITARGAI